MTREALKMALEALDQSVDTYFDKRDAAIAAIKAALAQPEKCPNHLDGTHVFDEHGQCYGTDCKALAKPEQEQPVGIGDKT
jgi:hypothetical protein